MGLMKGDAVTVLDAPQAIAVRQPGRVPCAKCGGDAVATMDVGATGSAMGTDFLHEPTCPEVVCAHGIRHSKVCTTCEDAERQKVRTCNRHDDCDTADAKAKADGRPRPDHCHDECCEDCFGC